MKKTHSPLTKMITWFDRYGLLTLASFLVVFLPLYPKLPLFDVIPGYIVRVRVEDILILFVSAIWAMQVYRKKIVWKNPLNPLIGLYALAGIASIFSAIVILGTIPLETIHLAKSTLHFLRYIEYFMLFFIFFSSIQKKKDVLVILTVLVATVMMIAVYGIGQKYFYWPVYSTMNREFSKGVRLILTEHARVQSTFGGHYDLAAYLVITLPLLLSIGVAAKKQSIKVMIWLAFTLGVWLLVVSGARMSFASYIIAVSVTIALLAFKKKNWRERIRWGVSRIALVGFLTFIIFLSFGEDMYERFLQTLEAYPELHEPYHQANDQRKELVQAYILTPLGLQNMKITKPDNAITTDEAAVMVSSDQQPTPLESDTRRPSDVYVEVPNIQQVETTSETGETTITYIETERVYSENALRHGLSLAIRLDTLWPQAIAGFERNPLLGTGYATLNKQSPTHFTEADSTDNNFLRTLGETGLLGFVTFYGIILFAMHQAYSLARLHSSDSIETAVAIGFFGASFGLLLNALYIDVFAASKVALAYWSLAGVVIALARLSSQKKVAKQSK